MHTVHNSYTLQCLAAGLVKGKGEERGREKGNKLLGLCIMWFLDFSAIRKLAILFFFFLILFLFPLGKAG